MPIHILFPVFLFFVSFAGHAMERKEEIKPNVQNQDLFYHFDVEKAANQDSIDFFKELNENAVATTKAGDEVDLFVKPFSRNSYYLYGKQKNYPLFKSRVLALKDLADKRKIKKWQVGARIQLGYYYFSIARNYGLGFNNYEELYELLKSSSVKDVKNKQELLVLIGQVYYRFGDNDRARKILTEALQTPTTYWQVPPQRKSRMLINMVNTLGLTYRQEKNYDSAINYFRKCYRIAENAQDSTWMGIAAGNIGISFYYQGKYDEALPLLELDIKESLKAGEFINALNSLMYQVEIYLKYNDLIKSRKQLQFARMLLPDAQKSHLLLPDAQKLHIIQKEYYALLSKLSALQGDYKRAFLYSDSAHVVNDSVQVQQEMLLALRAQQKLEIQKHHAEMLQLEGHEKQQTLIRNGLIIGIILLLIIAFVVVKYLEVLHRQKQLKLEFEKNTIASELEIATLQLADFTNSIREKNKLLEQYETEIAQQNFQGSKVSLETSKEAHEKLLQATILTDDQWKNFRHLFDKVHSGYLFRLHQTLPDLSPAETRYFVLSKLNLTSKEMAAMLGVRPDAIRQYRHRLRKKLNIEADNALEELIRGI